MKQCEICGNKNANVKLNYSYNDGFCSGSKNIMICRLCDDSTQHLEIGETLFVKVGSKLFYERNQDFGMIGFYTEVRDYEHFEYLKNSRRTDSFLEGINWKY